MTPTDEFKVRVAKAIQEGQRMLRNRRAAVEHTKQEQERKRIETKSSEILSGLPDIIRDGISNGNRVLRIMDIPPEEVETTSEDGSPENVKLKGVAAVVHEACEQADLKPEAHLIGQGRRALILILDEYVKP